MLINKQSNITIFNLLFFLLHTLLCTEATSWQYPTALWQNKILNVIINNIINFQKGLLCHCILLYRGPESINNIINDLQSNFKELYCISFQVWITSNVYKRQYIFNCFKIFSKDTWYMYTKSLSQDWKRLTLESWKIASLMTTWASGTRSKFYFLILCTNMSVAKITLG